MRRKNKFNFSKLFYNDKFVMFFSVFLAFTIWVSLPGNSEDITYTVIKDVPITVPDLGNELKVFYKSNDKASVRVSGNSLILRNLTKNDMVVTLDDEFTEIESATTGKYKLTAKKASIANDYSIKANSIDPAEIEVFVDREDSKVIPITVQTDAAVGEDYHMGTVTYTQKEVTVSGAQSILQKIDSVKAEYTFGEKLTETKNVEAKLKFYDKFNEEINSSYFYNEYVQAEFTSINIKIPVMKVKKLDVIPKFINIPDTLDTNGDLFTISPKTIDIAAPDDDTIDIDSVATKDIDLSKISSNKKTVTAELIIPSGITVINNESDVTVTFDTDEMTSRNFTVTNIESENIPAGKTVTYYSKMVNVTMIGKKSQLSQMKASDLTAVVDLSDITSGGGSVTKNARIEIRNSSMDQCWPYWLNDDPYPIVLSVSDKTESSEVSSSESSSASSTESSGRS